MGDLEGIIERVCSLFKDDCTGHDFFHTMRVYHLSIKIATKENADIEIVSLASLLHDVDDPKLFATIDYANTRNILREFSYSEEISQKVIDVIKTVSFKGKSVIPSSIEGKIVQDADRLDAIGAIGAIGIARAFAYGGAKGRKIYDPKETPLLKMDESTYRNHKGTTINHFYEKLLSLKEHMNTKEGKDIAERRHKYMEEFLNEFFLEWEEKD